MQTKAAIQKRSRDTRAKLREAEKRFAQYDNHEDMELIALLKAEADVLFWVLSEA